MPKPSPRTKSTRAMVHLTPQQKKALEHLAIEKDMTMSKLIASALKAQYPAIKNAK